MLNVPTPFPHAGCRAYLPSTSGLCTPVTVIRHEADGTSLVRHEPTSSSAAVGQKGLSLAADEHTAPAGLARNWPTDRDLRGASGNSTVETASLFETVAEAVEKANAMPIHKQARHTRNRRQQKETV